MEQIISSRIKYHQPYHLTNETGGNEFERFSLSAYNTMEMMQDKVFALFCITVANYDFIDEVFGMTTCNEMMSYLETQIECHLNSICDTYVRYSRDSFVVLMNCVDRTQMLAWLEYFNAHASLCELSENNKFKIDICGGIFEIGRDRPDLSIEEMAERAAIAIRSAANNRERFVFFDEQMRDKQLKEHEIVKSVHDAIENGEFKIYLQPQHYLQDGDRILSAEALVRWIKPNGTVIPPCEFVPVLEKNGLIAELDRHVMELACQFIHDNIDSSWYQGITISVNVSKVGLFSEDFIDFYTRTKNVYGIPDGYIEIEFTESAVFEDYDRFNKIMRDLEKNGFVCSLDDFGAGSSSLNMLKELPVEVLKMDRLFFLSSANSSDRRNEAVIASVVAMARGLGMKIIAEGIENPAQIDFLRRIGCDVIQGFAYSRPLPPDEFIKYVKEYIPLQASRKDAMVKDVASLNYSYATLLARYHDALQYINGIVIELDVSSDRFETISYRDCPMSFPYLDGVYSEALEELCRKSIRGDYTSLMKNMFSIQALTAAYYRGDKQVSMEFYAKRYDKEGGMFGDETAKYELSARFIRQGESSFLVTLYLTHKNLQTV